MLEIISENAQQEEQAIQDEINRAIDNYEPIIFNAGAGAGKTYALITSLKHILNHGELILERNHQKVICITYTNVAANEIKKRLGHSNLVEVSTIHERLWAIIKDQKQALLLIHQAKLESEIKRLESNLNDKTEDWNKIYRELSDDNKKSFKNYMLENKETYYQVRDKGAKNIENTFSESLTNYFVLKRNTGKFKDIVKSLFDIDKYQDCLNKMLNKERKYTAVKYDSKYNVDRFHRMSISHDTLLEYSYGVIKKHDLLKRMIIDSYPYILIDEYQDTSDYVVNIMRTLCLYGKTIKRQFFVGYFGDSAQNIYDKGVGKTITKKHTDLKNITKKFNRRSCKEIINVINTIRNDDIKQESIYQDCTGGSVKFYSAICDDTNELSVIDSFIHNYQQEWAITRENPLHCLLLTNKLVAGMSAFKNIYKGFAGTDYYKKNYNQLNTELLSDDLQKLGDIPSIFFKVIRLNVLLKEKTSLIVDSLDLLDKEVMKKIKFRELKELINVLQQLSGNTLKEYLIQLFNLDSKKPAYYKDLLEGFIELEFYSYQNLENYLLNKLFPNLDNDATEDATDKLNTLLDISIDEYIKWYEFITASHDNKDIIYHTYHGTKGDEFENVIVIMEKDFGREKGKFPAFFKAFLNQEEKSEPFEKTKNLLYVSCSRAIKNLRILYLGDTSEFYESINTIFGVPHNFYR